MSRKYRIIAIFLVLLASSAGVEARERPDMIAVSINGSHFMGPGFDISEFSVDGYSGGNVGPDGGGGSDWCCVLIPRKWRPGLFAEVKWEVYDIRNHNAAKALARDFSEVKRVGRYVAKVPIEKYEEPGTLNVHFFTGAKVRLIVYGGSTLSPDYPIRIPIDFVGTVEPATQGLLVEAKQKRQQ